ncbi:hypothetical protein IFM89_033923 [Coptis chinensis]|uniref:Uncharacterized protein n=1 Tax=Coptis chinensis TaxID=261450 RepID=A0A835HWC3_9MAGN|nr:hypothetical protein IFM89_033923 [Coptis chinensis]
MGAFWGTRVMEIVKNKTHKYQKKAMLKRDFSVCGRKWVASDYSYHKDLYSQNEAVLKACAEPPPSKNTASGAVVTAENNDNKANS